MKLLNIYSRESMSCSVSRLKWVMAVLICITPWLFCYSQQYHQLASSDAVWTVGFKTPSGPPQGTFIRFNLTGDTVINNATYKKIGADSYSNYQYIGTEYIGSIRDYNKTWLYIDKGETTERLFYNYDVQLSDTLTIYSLWANADWSVDSLEIIVTNIDSALINNDYRKRITVSSSVGSLMTENWIEGIGSESGLLFAGRNFCFDCGMLLECYKEDGNALYTDANYPNSCNVLSEVVDSRRLEKTTIVTFPNPADKEIKFDFKNGNDESVSIEVYSIAGQKLFIKKVIWNENYALDCSKWKNGVYYITITTSNRIISSSIVKL